MRFPAWRLSPTKLTVLLSAYFAFVLNWAFFRTVFQSYQPTGTAGDYFVYTVPLVLWALCYILLLLLSLPYVHKIIIPLLLILSAAVSYHSVFFNVYFDRHMLDNVLQTTPAESARMVSFSYVAWLLLLGVLPALLYVRTQCLYAVWWKEIAKRVMALGLSFVVILGVAAVYYQDYASFFRNHADIKHLIVPSNFITAGVSKLKRLRAENMPYAALGKDAKLNKSDKQRNVVIMVLGETTRAQNWGLNGYEKQTTPKLAARLQKGEAVINFPNVSSCGTATALSVPCLFSSMGREQYNEVKANRQDNILDTLQYAGAQLHWVENNSDCKGVCERIPTTNTIQLNLPDYCTDGECLDNIMLPELDKLLNAPSEQDLVVVLHSIGSHGPTYFERYTAQERLFTPTCDTREINRCSNDKLRNTYDNTIVYIDQLLDQIIHRLEQRPDWKSSLLFVSDHGESLGENGMYLHGTPYAIAPEYQTRVPMTMWLSPAWLKQKSTDLACLNSQSKQAYSHDNIFHTLVGLSDADPRTISQYRADEDILAKCRGNH